MYTSVQIYMQLHELTARVMKVKSPYKCTITSEQLCPEALNYDITTPDNIHYLKQTMIELELESYNISTKHKRNNTSYLGHCYTQSRVLPFDLHGLPPHCKWQWTVHLMPSGGKVGFNTSCHHRPRSILGATSTDDKHRSQNLLHDQQLTYN